MLCPFMTSWDNGSLREQECVKERCSLWDSVNNRCGAKISDYEKQILETILKFYEHQLKVVTPLINNTNKHSKSIDYHITRIDERSRKATISYAAILAQEFIQGQDFDGNGMVYGKDFKIENPPPILKALEDDLDWKEPSKIMTLNEYKSTLSEDVEEKIMWVYEEYENLKVGNGDKRV